LILSFRSIQTSSDVKLSTLSGIDMVDIETSLFWSGGDHLMKFNYKTKAGQTSGVFVKNPDNW